MKNPLPYSLRAQIDALRMLSIEKELLMPKRRKNLSGELSKWETKKRGVRSRKGELLPLISFSIDAMTKKNVRHCDDEEATFGRQTLADAHTKTSLVSRSNPKSAA
jgi:hypothetical protein